MNKLNAGHSRMWSNKIDREYYLHNQKCHNLHGRFIYHTKDLHTPTSNKTVSFAWWQR